MHRTLSPLVRQTGQLLGSDLINIRISHRHHIQSLTAEPPPVLLPTPPIRTNLKEPRRLETNRPTAPLRQSPDETRQHRFLRPQILLNRHTLGERRLRLRQTQRLLRTLRPRNQPTPRHQQNHAHKNTSGPGEHTTGHLKLPLAGAPRRRRKHGSSSTAAQAETWQLERCGAGRSTAAGSRRCARHRPTVPRARRALTDPPPTHHRTHPTGRTDPTGRSRPAQAEAGSEPHCPHRRPGTPPNQGTPPQSKAARTRPYPPSNHPTDDTQTHNEGRSAYPENRRFPFLHRLRHHHYVISMNHHHASDSESPCTADRTTPGQRSHQYPHQSPTPHTESHCGTTTPAPDQDPNPNNNGRAEAGTLR